MQDVQEARREFQENMNKLETRAKSFGRKDSLSEKYLEETVRPVPHYFAWSLSRELDGMQIQPVPDPIPEKISASVITSEASAPVAEDPVPVEKILAEPVVKVEAPAEKAPETKSEDPKPPPAVVKEPLQDKPKVPSPPDSSHAISAASPPSPAKKEPAEKPPVKSEKPSARHGSIKTPKANFNNVTPRYMLPLKPQAEKRIEKTEQPRGVGGGARGGTILDDLALLCKQHKLQYAHWKKDHRETKLPAGVPLPAKDKPPTFYAWETSASEVPNMTVRTCPGDAPLERPEPERAAPVAGVRTIWEAKSPFFYAYPIEYVKNESEEPVLETEKEKDTKVPVERTEEKLPTAGVTTVWNEKSPYFFAYPIKYLKEREEEAAKLKEESRDNLKQLLKTEEEPATDIDELKQESKENIQRLVTPEEEIEVAVSPVEEKKAITEADTKLFKARKELRRQRALGRKHHRFEAEIETGYIKRSEYMSQFRWPDYDLTDGHLGCVSAYAQRRISKPAGAPVSYYAEFVGTADRGKEIAERARHQFLKKKVVSGGIEELEGESLTKTIEKDEADENPVKTDLVSLKATKEDEKKEPEPVEKVETTLKTGSFDVPQKLNRTSKKFHVKRDKTPNYFAWKSTRKPTKQRRQRVKRWKPEPPKLENPILMFRRYPIPNWYHPRSEYQAKYRRMRLLKRKSRL